MATENTARLAEVGPPDPVHSFPMWFEDRDGVALELGLGPDPLLPAVDPPTESVEVPGQPFPETFPGESFYFLAESRMAIGGAGTVGRARLILGLEAAFAADIPDPRSRIVFARIRVRIDDVRPNATFTITHPYGVTDALESDDRGRVAWTDDRGIADNVFTAVRDHGLVAPFLRWDVDAPEGYLGDGVTEHAVTGSPFGTNLFRVEGPGVAVIPGQPAPAVPNVIESALFTVQGKRARRRGVEVIAAHYTRATNVVVIDVHARSAAGQEVEVGGPGVSRTALLGSDRSYVARAAAANVPTTIEVINAGDEPATSVRATVTDLITVTEAVHDPSAGTLTVSAFSSDDAGRTLEATGHGPLGAQPTVFTGVVATPAEVEVGSDAGGRTRRRVTLAGPPMPSLPTIAVIAPVADALVGEPVTLDGRASRSGITSWTWAQTSGPPVVLSDAAAAAPTFTPTFTPTVAGTYGFDLKVLGSAGAATADVEVVVTVPVPDAVAVDRVEFRSGRGEYRITGTQLGALPAEISVLVNGIEIGSGAVDAARAWSVRRTLGAEEGALRPTVGTSVLVRSSRGGRLTAPIRIRN